MIFTVSIADTAPLLALRNAPKRQAYAIANSINTSLLAVQKAVPEHLRARGFIMRKRPFWFGRGGQSGGAANKINRWDFANAKLGRLRGRVFIEASSLASQRRLLLPTFESGGLRRPSTPGARRVAVPLLGRPARPSLAAGVAPEYSFPGLRLKAYRGGKLVRRRMRGGHNRDVSTFGEYGRLQLPASDGATQWKGAHRTFLLPELKSGRTPGVFQRIGPGRSGVRLIHAFVVPPELPASLHYHRDAQGVTDRVFRPALLAEVRKTLEFHGRAA